MGKSLPEVVRADPGEERKRNGNSYPQILSTEVASDRDEPDRVAYAWDPENARKGDKSDGRKAKNQRLASKGCFLKRRRCEDDAQEAEVVDGVTSQLGRIGVHVAPRGNEEMRWGEQ